MNQEHRYLLSLLQRALTQRNVQDDPQALFISEPLSLETWEAVLASAERQEVVGLSFDALQRIPREELPPSDLLMRWTALACSDERDFRLYTQQVIAGLQWLNDNDIPVVMMKGLLLARLYPVPEHRPIGDVDLFVDTKYYSRAIGLLKQEGAIIDEQFDQKHTAVQYMGLNWELHFKSMYFFSRRSEKQYRSLEAEDTAKEELCTEKIDGQVSIQAFPPLLDILYLTAHIQHHLILEEIKIRHVIDWMLALQHNRTALAISEVQLMRQLNKLGMTNLFRALGYISVHYLGMNAESYAGCAHFSSQDAKNGEYLLRIILEGHIPGCKPYQPHTVNESFSQKVRLYWQLLLRCFHLRKLVAREARSTPLGYLCNAYRRRCHNKQQASN